MTYLPGRTPDASEVLVEAVRQFVTDIGSLIGARDPVAGEARAIAKAIIEADGHPSAAEVNAYSAALRPWLSAPPVPSRRPLGGPSALLKPPRLFERLVSSDASAGTAYSWRYYELAMRVAHAACAIDVLPTRDKLLAIDALRATLLTQLHANRIARPLTSTPGPTGPAVADVSKGRAHLPVLDESPSLEEALEEIDRLVGLDSVKTEVQLLINLVRIEQLRRERQLPVVTPSRHLVMVGNPGTGKTTVARQLARVLRALGVLSSGHLVETDRSGLVAGYIGQTAAKVNALADKAKGGVLFIDEAYSLAAGGNDFGSEAVATLVKRMEDDREDLVVIVAGYPEPMATFLDSNPGLRSRFSRTISFPDYSNQELVAIFNTIAEEHEYSAGPGALVAAEAWFAAQPRDANFGNGRLARNLFELCVARHATRLSDVAEPTNDQLMTIVEVDVPRLAGAGQQGKDGEPQPRVPAPGEPQAAENLDRSKNPIDDTCRLIAGLDQVPLSYYCVVPGYVRYDETVRQRLIDTHQAILEGLTEGANKRDNHLIWAPPGSGKTYLVQRIAASLPAQATYCELNLAGAPKEVFLDALKNLDPRRPSLCFIDEVDARPDETWPYEALLPALDTNPSQGAHLVFVLAGSSGGSLTDMKTAIGVRQKGVDLLSRVPVTNEHVVPPMGPGDRILAALTQFWLAGSERQRAINAVEKLALYYIAVTPELANPRQLREAVIRAVQRVPAWDNRVKYDHLFAAGDPKNKSFWWESEAAVAHLSNRYTVVTE